jgi:hypothetical protein
MEAAMQEQIQQLAATLRTGIESVPQTMRQESVDRQVIILLLADALRQMDLLPVPAWKPPKSTRECIDLVGITPNSNPPQVQVAFAVDPLVELPKLKALEWVECPHKIVVTFHTRADKVKLTTFFLKPGLEHVNLYD